MLLHKKGGKLEAEKDCSRKCRDERGFNMARFQCGVCGFVYDEEKEGKLFGEVKECPVCRQPASVFIQVPEEAEHDSDNREDKAAAGAPCGLEYDPEYVRQDASCRYMKEIHEMAVSGKTIIDAMGTKMAMPNWDDILILGAQLNPPPLMEHDPVSITTVIGKLEGIGRH